MNVTIDLKSPVPIAMMPFVPHSTSLAKMSWLVVVSCVVDEPSVTLSVPAAFRGCVAAAIVKVWAEPEEEVNVTLLNSTAPT